VARGVTNNPALEAWKARSLQPCRLPSGAWVKLRVPDAEALLRGDALPTDLLGVLRDFVGAGVDTEKLSDDDLQRWIEFMRVMSARTVVAVTTGTSDTMDPPADGWEDVDLTPEDFDELPVGDQGALRLVALRRATPNTITAQTLLDESLLEEAAAKRIADREAGATVDGYRDFREDGPGAQPGDDGTDVRAEPEPDLSRD
jgi:hypothetical protein